MAPLSFGDIPQLQELRFAWQRCVCAQRVVLAVTDSHLICSWMSRDQWFWRSGSLPPDCCREGVPLQPAIIGDFLGEFLQDCDLPGAQIELLLPLQACRWRLFETGSQDPIQIVETARAFLAGLNDSLEPGNLDVSTQSLGDDTLVIGVVRSVLQAWIEVVASADVPLRRVEWSLVSALRAVQRFIPEDFSGDLAWLIQSSGQPGCRLVLLRDGLPEVDQSVRTNDDAAAIFTGTTQAWRSLHGPQPLPLGWLVSAADQKLSDPARWMNEVSVDRQLILKNTWTPSPLVPEQEPIKMDPFLHLAFAGLCDEQS